MAASAGSVMSAGILHAAAAGDHGVAWACGILVQGGGRPFATLIFRRHGHGWEQVEAPQIGRVNRALAVSDADSAGSIPVTRSTPPRRPAA